MSLAAFTYFWKTSRSLFEHVRLCDKWKRYICGYSIIISRDATVIWRKLLSRLHPPPPKVYVGYKCLFGAFAERRRVLASPCPSVILLTSGRLLQAGYPWNFIFGVFNNIFLLVILLKIAQNDGYLTWKRTCVYIFFSSWMVLVNETDSSLRSSHWSRRFIFYNGHRMCSLRCKMRGWRNSWTSNIEHHQM
jgi:hypothetical protein